MKKLNRKYVSFLEFIKDPLNDEPSNNRYDDGANEHPLKMANVVHEMDIIYPGYQFLGALRPIVKMGKDFLDTFKPYYSTGKIKRDLLQPVRGITNIFRGIVIIVGALISIALWGVCLVPGLLYEPAIYLSKIIYPLSWLIEGSLEIVRGATQCVTSPLVIFKILLRGILTLASDKKMFAEEKPEIQRLVKEAENIIKSRLLVDNIMPICKKSEDDPNSMKKVNRLIGLLTEIDRKHVKSLKDGWSTAHQKKEPQSGPATLNTHQKFEATLSIFKFQKSSDLGVYADKANIFLADFKMN